MTSKKSTLITLIAISLSGCTVGPRYSTPEVCISDEWHESADSDLPSEAWWESFNDEQLTTYIERAVASNNDLMIAEANILQARAMRRVAASQLFPQLDLDVNGSRTYFSKSGPVFALQNSTQGANIQTGLPFVLQFPQTQNLYNFLFDATWEIDLFGRVRRGVEAAKATIESVMEARNDRLISLRGEVASTYIEVRSAQQKGALIEQQIALLEKKQAIAEEQLKAGYSSEMALLSIEAQLAAQKAQLPDCLADIYRSIYALSVLTGDLPETLLGEMLPIKELPIIPDKVSVGVRSDLLKRRPDVRQAERELAVATANVGVAVASFFPTITLLGDGGLQSLNLNNLFQAGSRTWAFGADLNLPLFQGGNLIGNLRATEAVLIGSGYNYQKTILKALEETESALMAFNQEKKKEAFLEESRLQNQRLVHIAKARYERGLTDYTLYLDQQNQLLQSEESLLASQTALLNTLITLYKALGGEF